MASNSNKKLNYGSFYENDVLMGALLSRKSSIDLLQNCDLPPPLKVFSGSDKTIISSMNRVVSMMGKEEETNDFDIYRSGGGGGGGGDENGKLEVLKALRLSQTRAREAEKKVASLGKENNCISNALLRESMQLIAYRQWVRLLEVQVMKLQSEWKHHQDNKWCCSCGERIELLKEGKDCGSGSGGVSWFLALAFCLGIAGVGLAFGCRYLF